MKDNIFLVTGGARSGKSTFAQDLAQSRGTKVTYLATAEAGDPEMRERIAKHQAARPASWATVEAPLQVKEAIQAHGWTAEVILVDCITLFISNLVFREIGLVAENEDPVIDPGIAGAVAAEIEAVIQAAAAVPATVIFVTNELGNSLVPPNHLGRLYRDLVGRANQEIATAASQVYLVTCGLAVNIKALATRL